MIPLKKNTKEFLKFFLKFGFFQKFFKNYKVILPQQFLKILFEKFYYAT